MFIVLRIALAVPSTAFSDCTGRGKKELIGHTDLDVEISNQCGRLVANIVIAYNSILLSELLNRYQAENNQNALGRLKQISPVAWQHIHFSGHYTFRNKQNPIDIDAILASPILM